MRANNKGHKQAHSTHGRIEASKILTPSMCRPGNYREAKVDLISVMLEKQRRKLAEEAEIKAQHGKVRVIFHKEN